MTREYRQKAGEAGDVITVNGEQMIVWSRAPRANERWCLAEDSQTPILVVLPAKGKGDPRVSPTQWHRDVWRATKDRCDTLIKRGSLFLVVHEPAYERLHAGGRGRRIPHQDKLRYHADLACPDAVGKEHSERPAGSVWELVDHLLGRRLRPYFNPDTLCALCILERP